MTPLLELAECFLLLENAAFWIERIITITLTPLWIQSCYSLLVYSKLSPLFHFTTSLSVAGIICPNIIYLLPPVRRAYHCRNKAQYEQRQAAEVIKKNWHSKERLAFWFDRCGMLILLIWKFPLGYTYHQRFGISLLPCMILFPVANLLYLRRFACGEQSENPEGVVECGFCSAWKLYQCLSSLKDKLVRLKNWLEEPIPSEEEDWWEEQIPIEDDENYQDRLKHAEEKYKINSPMIPNVNGSRRNDQQSETEADSIKELCDDNLSDLEAEDQQEYKNQTIGLAADQAFSQEGFGVLDYNEYNQIKGRILELEQEIAEVKDNYQKKLKIVEAKWEKKLKEVREKYMEESQEWKEQEKDLISRLSATTAQAEIYRLLVEDGREIHHKLQEEKIDLIMKLCSANSSSELYRSLLHDQLTWALPRRI